MLEFYGFVLIIDNGYGQVEHTSAQWQTSAKSGVPVAAESQFIEHILLCFVWSTITTVITPLLCPSHVAANDHDVDRVNTELA